MSVLFTRRGPAPAGGGSGGGGVSGTLGSDLEIGSSVFLNVDGTLMEFLVVHQGLPSSSYDSSCDGTWLLMKNILVTREWNSMNSCSYADASINTYLTEDVLPMFDTSVQEIMMDATLPSSGSTTAKVFLLGACEVGFDTNDNSVLSSAKDSVLDYFSNAGDEKRIAYYDGVATGWWTRWYKSSSSYNPYGAANVDENGNYSTNTSNLVVRGVRPALILPSNAVFDPDTMEFVGVGGNSSGGSENTKTIVNITGTGDSEYCYAIVNGTKYTGAASNIELTSNSITFGVYGIDGAAIDPELGTYIGEVTIDGNVVLQALDGEVETYQWTVPSGLTEVNIVLEDDNRATYVIVTTSTGGVTEPETYTVTITGEGSTSSSTWGQAYVTIDGKTYTDATTITVNKGSIVSCYALTRDSSGGNATIYLDGVAMKQTTSANSLISYDYQINSNITIALDYGATAKAKVNITTT